MAPHPHIRNSLILPAMLPSILRTVGLFALWAVLVCATLRVAVGSEVFDLASPIVYAGDGISHSAVVKWIMDEGWFPSYNRYLGAPFRATSLDYWGSDALHYILIKLIATFSDDWVLVQGLYFLLGFVLCGFFAHLVLRYLGLGTAFAVLGSMLFAFLPYHFLRTQHLFLISYFCVPIATWLALEAWRLGCLRGAGTRMHTRDWFKLGAASVCISACGIYYAFFTAVMLVAVAIVVWSGARSWRASWPSLAMMVIIGVTVIASNAPSFLYRMHEGPNTEVAQRHPAESEIYGLTLTQLIFPRPSHRWEQAREYTARYEHQSPYNYERQAESIGLMGTLGLLVLAHAAFGRFAGGNEGVTTLERLSFLTLVCFMLATVSGVGAILAWTVMPMIRGYARASVFIGFTAISGLMIALQAGLAKMQSGANIGGVRMLVVLLAGAVGIWDQTRSGEFARGAGEKQFESDRAFVRTAENALPPGAQVYQLPFHPFPESGPVNQLGDYDLFRGYLHSKALRWSYGNMKGRSEALWQAALNAHSLPAQLDVARASGFSAVYVDTRGYADGGIAIEASLRHELGEPMLVSDDRSLAMYRIAMSHPSAPAGDAIPPITDVVDLSANHLDPAALLGFGQGEPWGRWTTSSSANMVFLRPLPSHFAINVEVVNVFGPNAGAQIGVRVGDEEKTFAGDGLPKWVRLEFRPGRAEHLVRMLIPHPTSPASLGQGADDRLLGLGVKHVQIIPLD